MTYLSNLSPAWAIVERAREKKAALEALEAASGYPPDLTEDDCDALVVAMSMQCLQIVDGRVERQWDYSRPEETARLDRALRRVNAALVADDIQLPSIEHLLASLVLTFDDTPAIPEYVSSWFWEQVGPDWERNEL